jgi:hypothetical protein
MKRCWGEEGSTEGEVLDVGVYWGREENFSSKFTASRTLSIPSSLTAFLKKLFLEGVTGVEAEG